MAKNIYESNIHELIKAIDASFKGKESLSGLILLYSLIDIMAWLSRDQHDADSTKSDFIHWVEEFLLPGSSLACTGEDLYSARCSIIHSYAPEWGSSMGRQSEAKKIHYIWGKAGKVTPVGHANSSSEKKDENVVLHIDDLVNALKIAIQRFNDSLSYNRALFELIDDRSRKFFIGVAKEELE
jgi:hypothetical protein